MKFTRRDIALVALRIALGAAIAGHGLPKIMHPTTWANHILPGAPGSLAALAAGIELGGGVAIVIGLFARVASFLIAADMVIAIFFVLLPHGAPFVAPNSRMSLELPLAYLAIAFALILVGAGSISCDALRDRGGRNGGRGRKR